jgi:hypothetical protein
MTDSFEKAGQEALAFQKMWTESLSKSVQTAFKFTPDAAPPEVVRQIRAGILQTLAESWDEFMRSPQFLEGMRQWMENAVAFRKISNEFLGRARHELQATSRTDIDTVMLAMRHMEKRLLDRLEDLSRQIGNGSGAPRSKQRGPDRSPASSRKQNRGKESSRRK